MAKHTTEPEELDALASLRLTADQEKLLSQAVDRLTDKIERDVKKRFRIAILVAGSAATAYGLFSLYSMRSSIKESVVAGLKDDEKLRQDIQREVTTRTAGEIEPLLKDAKKELQDLKGEREDDNITARRSLTDLDALIRQLKTEQSRRSSNATRPD